MKATTACKPNLKLCKNTLKDIPKKNTEQKRHVLSEREVWMCYDVYRE